MDKKKDRLFLFDLDRDGLHRQMGGGIPKGTIMTITGMDGAGKSAIAQRLIYGLTRHNYRLTVVSTELTTKGFIDQMDSLDYPVMSDVLSRELVFIPVFPLIGAARKREDFLGRLLTTKGIYDSDIIVIDTFSALIKHDIDEERAFEVLSFFKKMAGQSKTIILTMDARDLSERIMAPFRSVSDILIELERDVIEGSVEHKMFVTRFGTAQGPVSNAVGFRIEPGAGFIVDITLVA